MLGTFVIHLVPSHSHASTGDTEVDPEIAEIPIPSPAKKIPGTPAQRKGIEETSGLSLGVALSYGGIAGMRASTPLVLPVTDEGGIDLMGVLDLATAGVETWTEKRSGQEAALELTAGMRIPRTHILATGMARVGGHWTHGDVIPANEDISLLTAPDTEATERKGMPFSEDITLWRQGNLTDNSRDGRVHRGVGVIGELPSFENEYGSTTVSAGGIGPTYGGTSLLIEPAIWTHLIQDPGKADHLARLTLETGIDTERALMFSMPSKISFAAKSLVPRDMRDNGEIGMGNMELKLHTEPRICPVVSHTLICAGVYGDATFQSAGAYAQTYVEGGFRLTGTVLPAQ